MKEEDEIFEYHIFDESIDRFIIQFKVIDKQGINIIDGYKTKNDIYKEKFIDYAIWAWESSLGKRTKKSLMREWKAHNICYNKGWFKSRAKDTFLNKDEKWYRRVFYAIICFIFKEK